MRCLLSSVCCFGGSGARRVGGAGNLFVSVGTLLILSQRCRSGRFARELVLTGNLSKGNIASYHFVLVTVTLRYLTWVVTW